jgi:transcriptional accessory protein Tex/SPT6
MEMMEKHISKIAQELQLTEKQVWAASLLLGEGATVPFIARYRREVTGELDEVNIISIRDRLEKLDTLDKRRASVLKSLEEHGKLTDELKGKVLAAETPHPWHSGEGTGARAVGSKDIRTGRHRPRGGGRCLCPSRKGGGKG